MTGLYHLLFAALVLALASGSLAAMPDMGVRAAVFPILLTSLFVAAGAVLLRRREQALAGAEPIPPVDLPPPVPSADEAPVRTPKQPFSLRRFLPFRPVPRPAASVPAFRLPDVPELASSEFATTLDSLLADPVLADPLAAIPEQPDPAPIDRRAAGADDRLEIGGLADRAIDDTSRDDGPPDVRAVAAAIEEDRLRRVLAPIVSLPQRRRRMVLVQLVCDLDGIAVDPRAVLGNREPELAAALALETLRAAIDLANRPPPEADGVPLVADLSLTPFLDPDAARAFQALLARRLPRAAALTVVLDDWPVEPQLQALAAQLRSARIALGLALGSGLRLSPNAIADRQAALVLLPAKEIHEAALAGTDLDLVADLETLARRRVELVVTGIGTERELAEVLDYPVQLGAGELFSRTV